MSEAQKKSDVVARNIGAALAVVDMLAKLAPELGEDRKEIIDHLDSDENFNVAPLDTICQMGMFSFGMAVVSAFREQPLDVVILPRPESEIHRSDAAQVKSYDEDLDETDDKII